MSTPNPTPARIDAGHGILGYYDTDLRAYFKDDPRLAAYDDFMKGQTTTLHEGKSLVYEWDVARFLRAQRAVGIRAGGGH